MLRYTAAVLAYGLIAWMMWRLCAGGRMEDEMADGLRQGVQAPDEVVIDYTNHRGVRERRSVMPRAIFFGTSEFHPGPAQWFLSAYALDRRAERVFAMRGIHEWGVK